MNFWKTMYTKWSSEELSKWSSFRKTAYLILPLLIYFLVHDGMEVLLWAVLDRVMTMGNTGLSGFLTGNADTVRGCINGIAIMTGVSVIWPALRREIAGKENALTGKDNQKRNMAKLTSQYAFLAALAFLSALGLNLLFYATGFVASSQSYGDTSRAQYGVNFFIGLLLYGIISPFAEEAVFRGLIFNRMKRCFGLFLGVTVSALLFGCYHGNLVQGLYGTLLGLLIACLYEKYGSFAAPVLFHSVANISVYVMSYYGSFSNMSREVSIGMTAVFLAGAVFCLWYIMKRLNFEKK